VDPVYDRTSMTLVTITRSMLIRRSRRRKSECARGRADWCVGIPALTDRDTDT